MRTILLLLFFSSSMFIYSCGGGTGTAETSYDAFNAPELVTITGYSSDIMEPFFSRDERYLFFNDNAAGWKNLHYAAYNALNDEFTYIGEIGPGINDGSSVQGVPTMTANNDFYYVDTKFYDPLATVPVYNTLFTGSWDGTNVTGVAPVAGIAFPVAGFLNFDLDISPDGTTLYFNDGVFSGNPLPDAAEIKVANYDTGSGQFVRDPNAATIMANINTTTSLEYAPSISADGLELFFTRLDLGSMDARIYRTTRVDTASVFGPPQLVSAIPGFAEGTTYSLDEKTLYYHWQNATTGKFELYRVTRP